MITDKPICGYKGDPVCEPPDCRGACPITGTDSRPSKDSNWIKHLYRKDGTPSMVFPEVLEVFDTSEVHFLRSLTSADTVRITHNDGSYTEYTWKAS